MYVSLTINYNIITLLKKIGKLKKLKDFGIFKF